MIGMPDSPVQVDVDDTNIYFGAWLFTNADNDVVSFTKRYNHEPTVNEVRHDGYLWYHEDDPEPPSFGRWMDSLCQVGQVTIEPEQVKLAPPLTVFVAALEYGGVTEIEVFTTEAAANAALMAHLELPDGVSLDEWYTVRYRDDDSAVPKWFSEKTDGSYVGEFPAKNECWNGVVDMLMSYRVSLHAEAVDVHKVVYVEAISPEDAVMKARAMEANWVFAGTPVEDRTRAKAVQWELRR